MGWFEKMFNHMMMKRVRLTKKSQDHLLDEFNSIIKAYNKGKTLGILCCPDDYGRIKWMIYKAKHPYSVRALKGPFKKRKMKK